MGVIEETSINLNGAIGYTHNRPNMTNSFRRTLAEETVDGRRRVPLASGADEVHPEGTPRESGEESRISRKTQKKKNSEPRWSFRSQNFN